MNTPRSLISRFVLGVALLAAVVPAVAQPVAIRSAGVLGNSGEAGDTLVRFDGRVDPRAALIGLGVDPDGFIWSFSGTGSVSRYSVDGRRLASHPVPRGAGRGRMFLAVVGHQVLLLGNERLHTLDARAESGAAFAETPHRARAISTSSIDGRIALITPDNELAVLDVPSGRAVSRGALPEGARNNFIVLLPDGSLIIDRNLKIAADGGQTRVNLPGSWPVFVGGHLYAFAWHTTIHRVDDNGSPSPGVVLGGSSGSFIGTLPKDGEIHHPIGLVVLGGGRFAIAGALGVIHILEWDEARRAFAGVRRIGAVHRSSGLAVDRQGRVWWNCGYWDWTDGPATYPRNTLHMTDDEGWQMAMLASDAMVGLSTQSNRRVLVVGAIDPEPRNRFDRGVHAVADSLPANPTGALVLGAPGREEGVFVNARGEGARLSLHPDGRHRALLGKVRIKTASAEPGITSLGRTPRDGVIVADGGTIVRVRAAGETWTETARITGWGDQRFGAKIHLATDDDRLWVSDADNHRVLLFRLTEEGPLEAPVIFTGDEVIGALKTPGRIAARGDRAVVVDEGNQRLVRLEVAGR